MSSVVCVTAKRREAASGVSERVSCMGESRARCRISSECVADTAEETRVGERALECGSRASTPRRTRPQ